MSPYKSLLNLRSILASIAVAVAGLALLIFAFLIYESWPLLSKIPFSKFFSDTSWHPTEQQYNLLSMVVGTLLTAIGALLIAAPLSIASAIFCQFYAPPLIAKIYTSIIELLSGIPSVVFGLWGLVVLVPIVASWQGPGTSLLAGILVLSIMVLPTGALLAATALAETPSNWREGAAALGLSRWAMVKNIALPTAKSGLLNALILQAGRAIGETMAVLMVCGNIVAIPDSLFAPVRTLSANIALEMAYAMGDHRAALYVSGLVLLSLVAALLMFSRPMREVSYHA